MAAGPRPSAQLVGLATADMSCVLGMGKADVGACSEPRGGARLASKRALSPRAEVTSMTGVWVTPLSLSPTQPTGLIFTTTDYDE